MACDKCKRVPPELKEVKPGHFVACHFADQQKIDEMLDAMQSIQVTEQEATEN